MSDTSEDSIVDVIFKKEGKDVVAFFPALPGTGPYDCECYAHIGQHGSADMGYVASCKPAQPGEYADLKAELEAVPYCYKFRVVRCATEKHRLARKEACK
jgi:hypothetical protein